MTNEIETLSSYGRTIFDAVFSRNGGNIAIQARAGSGKTRMLKIISLNLKESGVYLVFAKKNQEEAKEKLAGSMVEPKTTYSLGMGAIYSEARRKGVKKVVVDKNKYLNIVESWLSDVLEPIHRPEYETANIIPNFEEYDLLNEFGLCEDIEQLINLAQLNIFDPRRSNDEELTNICNHHGIMITVGLEALTFRLVRYALNKGINNFGTINYSDMLWLVLMHKLRVKQYKWVLIDESQDLSPAQIKVSLMASLPGGRIISVGDDRQSIFGFAGADSNSFNNVVEQTNATVYPLPICYRCPISHIELAKNIVPDLEARQDAIQGSIRNIPEGDLVNDLVDRRALILCRVNAPIMKHAYALLKMGRKVAVFGNDLGKGLKFIVRQILGAPARGKKKKANEPTFTFLELSSKMSEFLRTQKESLEKKYEGKKLQEQIDRISDRCMSVMCVAESNMESNTVSKLYQSIDAIFACTNPDILFSSVHRAKGLEHNSVYILNPEKLGQSRADNPEWMNFQEQNLHYVALTRAMNELVFLTPKSKTSETPKAS